MKKIAQILVIGAVSFSTAVRAESERPQSAPNSQQPAGEGSERPSYRRFSGVPQGEGEYVDRWLESLKERSPEEFERAKRMRQENPEEFRKHLHKKLEEMRTKGGQPGGSLREHPAIIEALKNIPAEDREWAMQRLQQMPMMNRGDGMRGDGFMDFKHTYSPEMQRGEERARELARKCREAKSDDEKATAKKELRETLASMFDQREKTRAESFKQMEEKFAKLRQQMEERQKDREKLIDARLEEVLRGDAPKR